MLTLPSLAGFCEVLNIIGALFAFLTYRNKSKPVIDDVIKKTTRCQKLPFNYAATQWNSLSPEIRFSPLIDIFKHIVKIKLFEQYHLDNIDTN